MNEKTSLPLAIATVPMQRFEKLYPLEKALAHGTLFLDTHPTNTCALKAYRQLRTQREAAVRAYEAAVGPVDFYSAGGKNAWNWVQGPWPWETEA